MNRQKAYFLSHGGPTLVVDDVPSHHFLKTLANDFLPPKAILMVSAHWETEYPVVNKMDINETIHDFYNFPAELYQLQYPAHGSEELSNRVVELLSNAGLKTGIDSHRGLDHGAWIPLMLSNPEHEIPVVQLSIQAHLGPGHHFEIGRALAPLRDENVLIIGSGSYTHNLRALSWGRFDAPEPEWVKEFSNWMHDAIMNNKTCDLMAYRRLAPFAQMAHPRDEHLLPLFVAMGAANPITNPKHIHESVLAGSLRMDCYSFE